MTGGPVAATVPGVSRPPADARRGIVALDLQALQPGAVGGPFDTGADGEPATVVARVVGLARALARAGRLAAVLLSPDRPAPELGPSDESLFGDLVVWDGMDAARRLIGDHPGLVRLVPAPFLLAGGGPASSVVSRHWAATGIARIVTVDEDALARARVGAGPAVALRLDARDRWARDSDLVVAVGNGPGADALTGPELFGSELAGPEPAGPEPAGPAPVGPAVGEIVAFLDRRNPAAAPGPPFRPARRIALVGPFPPGGGGIGAYNGRLAGALGAVADVDAIAPVRTDWTPPAGVRRAHVESLGTDLVPASYDAVVYTLGNSAGHLATVETALRHPGWLWLHEAQLPAIATTALESFDDAEFAVRMAWLLERAYPGRPPLAAARAAGRSHIALAAAGVGLTAPLVAAATGVLVNSMAARRAVEMDQLPLAWQPPVAVLPPACPPVRPRPAGPSGETVGGPVVVALGVVSMSKRPDLLVDAAAQGGFRLAFVGPCPDILRMVIGDRAAARGVADRVEVTGALGDDEWWRWMDRAAVAVQLRDSASGEMSAAVLDALSAGVPVVTNLASARDYPAGTVQLVAGPHPEAVASAVDRLLSDPGARRDLAEAGRHFAATHQMSDLAAALLEAVAG